MSKPAPVIVVCCCGWHGPLGAKRPCPNCSASHYSRITKQRLHWLVAVEAGAAIDRMPRNGRAWFLRTGLMVPSGAAPEPRRGVARFPRGSLQLTELGAQVRAAAGQP